MGTSLETERIIGPMGSEFFHLKVPPDMFPDFARLDWNTIGKRVMIDPIDGIISWMSPAETHSFTVQDTAKIVERSASILKLHCRSAGDNRWRPSNTDRKIEADASFYIGENALRYYAAIRDVEDEDAAEKMFCRQNPPDLVIEVEVTHFDARKPAMYKDLGVHEMWQINRSKRQGGKLALATILDLMAPDHKGGPREIEQSLVLPGLKASTLPQALHLSRHGRYQALRTLLEKDLIVPVPAPSRPPEPSSFRP